MQKNKISMGGKSGILKNPNEEDSYQTHLLIRSIEVFRFQTTAPTTSLENRTKHFSFATLPRPNYDWSCEWKRNKDVSFGLWRSSNTLYQPQAEQVLSSNTGKRKSTQVERLMATLGSERSTVEATMRGTGLTRVNRTQTTLP